MKIINCINLIRLNIVGNEFLLCCKMKIGNKNMTCWEVVRDTSCPFKEELTPEYKEILLEEKYVKVIFYIKEEI